MDSAADCSKISSEDVALSVGLVEFGTSAESE